MLVIVLWALTPSDCAPPGQKVNSSEVAKVKEMQGPAMTIKEEVIPGYFTFNDGQPFLVDKDPLTGSLNFNIKTTPVRSQQLFKNSEDDYLYEDETGYGRETIDRKDGDIYGLKTYGQNDIKDSTKSQEDLHKFLNLPVHYNNHNKFPLISSSYANTKVQGHGSSSYSNHKPYSTTSTTTRSPSTSAPSQNTQKSHDTTTTPSTTIRTTTPYRTTTATQKTTTPSAYDYEYVDYYDDKYDQESSERPALNYIPSGQHPSTTYTTSKPTTIVSSTTTTPTTTTTIATTFTTSTTTTRKPPTYYTEPTKPSSVRTTPREKVAIVTSLPIDPKDEPEMDKTPLSIRLSTTTNKIDSMTTKGFGFSVLSRNETDSQVEDSASNVVINISAKPTNANTDLEFGMRITTEGPYRGTFPNKTSVEPTGFGYGVPSINSGVVPGLRPPPWGYGGVPPFQPMGSVHPHVLPPKRPPVNTEYKPPYEGNYVKPTKISGGHPTPPHTYLTVGSNHPSHHFPPVMNKPPPPFFPEHQTHASSVNHQSFENVKHKLPEKFNGDNFNIVVGNIPKLPPQPLNLSSASQGEAKKPVDQPPEFNVKPSHPTKIHLPHPPYETSNGHAGIQYGPKRPPIGFPENQQKPSEGFSLVPSNQYGKVPQDQANPSYSLQTSFSIGAPQYDEEKETPRPMQGVGQVLFPDDDKVIEGNKKPSTWPQGQHGPSNNPPIGPHHHAVVRPPMPPQVRPPQRYPLPEMHQNVPDGYPRPHWDSHVKHPYLFTSGPKKDSMNPTPNFIPPKRPKPQNPQRPDLPNILPQFRPNAKVGPGEYHGPPHPNHPPYINPPKVREPFDTLQPPPLPRPQFLRHHGNEEQFPEKKIDKKEQLPVHLPLVHKRMTGPQSGSRVTPLGFMQGNLPPRNAMLRNDFKEVEKNKDEPVFVVYPSNGGNKPSSPSEGVVVVGTRGSQRPLPPDNLGIQEDLDPFPLDDNSNFPIPNRDRTDTPILKIKSTTKPHHKPEFPYSLVKPGGVEPPQKIISGGMIDLKKEYTAYSPTVSSSTEEILLKEHDSEINIIPYLQDYMPYATKKPFSKPVDGWNVEDKSTLKPLSVTLNTFLGSTNKPIKNHLMVTEKIDSEPERQDFQAPFHASLSEPSQGWSVVTQNNVASDKSSDDDITPKPTEETKFDIDNFKPELLSGFKPIIPPKFDDDRPTTKAAAT